MKPLIRIHNLETNEIIDREMNAAELKQLEQANVEQNLMQAEAAAKAAARQAVLDKLGLTADDIAALGL